MTLYDEGQSAWAKMDTDEEVCTSFSSGSLLLSRATSVINISDLAFHAYPTNTSHALLMPSHNVSAFTVFACCGHSPHHTTTSVTIFPVPVPTADAWIMTSYLIVTTLLIPHTTRPPHPMPKYAILIHSCLDKNYCGLQSCVVWTCATSCIACALYEHVLLSHVRCICMCLSHRNVCAEVPPEQNYAVKVSAQKN